MSAPSRRVLHPNRAVALVFLLLIAAGTVLLRLPAAQVDAQPAPWLTALFTAVSAVCVTGLVVVDTGTSGRPSGRA
jgi:trk system potassium uptake protein TrkH